MALREPAAADLGLLVFVIFFVAALLDDGLRIVLPGIRRLPARGLEEMISSRDLSRLVDILLVVWLSKKVREGRTDLLPAKSSTNNKSTRHRGAHSLIYLQA